MVPGRGSRSIFSAWRSSAARAASQLRSLRLFRPVTPVTARAAALFVRRDFEACAKAFARKSHRNNWPETNVDTLLAVKLF